MSASPTGLWCDWFDSLTPAIATELAGALIQLAPAVLGSTTEDFSARIRKLPAGSMDDAGTALILGALTDFVFLQRSTPDRWEKNRQMLEILDDVQQSYLSEDDALAAELGDWIQETRLRHPLRARQWVKEFESWSELRKGALDPAAIHRALYELLSR
jgi:hypothetical protein